MVSFMEDYKDIIEEGCKINEANESAFKLKIVMDLLYSLGWEKQDIDVEYPIKMGTSRQGQKDRRTGSLKTLRNG